MTIREGTIVTELFILGPQYVKVLTVNQAMNTAVVQFRELGKTPNESNTKTVTLDKLQAK